MEKETGCTAKVKGDSASSRCNQLGSRYTVVSVLSKKNRRAISNRNMNQPAKYSIFAEGAQHD
ncbi:MAG: hypothetical protein OHK0011_12440 [Turneriella sp.]